MRLKFITKFALALLVMFGSAVSVKSGVITDGVEYEPAIYDSAIYSTPAYMSPAEDTLINDSYCRKGFIMLKNPATNRTLCYKCDYGEIKYHPIAKKYGCYRCNRGFSLIWNSVSKKFECYTCRRGYKLTWHPIQRKYNCYRCPKYRDKTFTLVWNPKLKKFQCVRCYYKKNSTPVWDASKGYFVCR